ncbi:hypothetical protein OIU34_30100 [Pararhizobium sp. BT-229]|uniref:hypothetical protein n=1 Tax=Pararhizobium sp. BT-229 TaxID=2986923 RepID=UPI0021F7C6D4|nr:hypothetical protein [Pararhizobium sp. BT-229]MCV9966127.1 hypothetical protein [Pararhizobium sp. BT-229]
MIVWYLVVAVFTLVLFGVAVHVFRSSFNIIPDRLNPGRGLFWREHAVDDMFSTNYGFWDMVAGTEYDEDGFYEFFSIKNLRIACTWSVALGLAVLLSYAELWESFTSIVDRAPGWLWELIVYRVKNIRLI